MCFDDFLYYFSNLTIVHVNLNAFYNDEKLNRKEFNWKCKSYHGEFRPGEHLGGGISFDRNGIFKNPQYLIRVQDVDPEDNDNKATLIVSLMQKESIKRRAENYGEPNEEPVQFRIYKLLNEKYFYQESQGNFHFNEEDLKLAGDSGNFITTQVVTKRFKLDPGAYVIIPIAYKTNSNLKFLLRLYTESEIKESMYEYENLIPKVVTNRSDLDNYGIMQNYNYNDPNYDPYSQYLESNNFIGQDISQYEQRISYGWRHDL